MLAAMAVKSSYRQTIVTKYHGPTNTRGARITAKAEAGSMSLSWDHALNADKNHEAAVAALVKKLGWDEAGGDWVGGAVDGVGVVWVNVY